MNECDQNDSDCMNKWGKNEFSPYFQHILLFIVRICTKVQLILMRKNVINAMDVFEHAMQ